MFIEGNGDGEKLICFRITFACSPFARDGIVNYWNELHLMLFYLNANH